MKKLLILSALLIFACSGGGDANDNDSNQNFLEKYDGIIWKGTNNNQGDTNDNNGFEYWIVFSPNGHYTCDNHLGGYESNSYNWGQVYTVIENSLERLILEADSVGGVPYLTTIEVTNNGNNIMISTPGLEDDDPDYIEYYERVSSNPCN